jgi:hypothetical protein
MNKIKVWLETFNVERKKNLSIAICIFFIGLIISYVFNFGYSLERFLGFNFNASVIPGWDVTFFPTFFSTGWIYSSLLSTMLLLSLFLIFFPKIKVVNTTIVEILNAGILILGTFSALGFLFELIISWYSGYIYEQYAFYNRAFGFLWFMYFLMILINIFIPHLFWFRKIRKSLLATLIICIILKLSLLIPNFPIYAAAKAQDYLPSSWSFESDFNYKFLLLLIPIAILIRLIFIISKKK